MKYVQDLIKEPTFKRLLNISEGRVSLRTTANFGVLHAGSPPRFTAVFDLSPHLWDLWYYPSLSFIDLKSSLGRI